MRRIALSLAMLATGAALMIAAQLAGASPERKGGIFRVGTVGASVQVDPQLAYITTAWWLEYATAAKLVNYSPSGRLVNEVASRYTISNGGLRYTFVLRKGFRFSDGTPVTARNFVYAFQRSRSPGLASPAKEFIETVSSIRAKGSRRLVITLRQKNENLLSTLAMPFFQATSMKLPLNSEVFEVGSMADLPSAGPYAFTRNDPDSQTSLRRNPFWKRGPGRMQPRNLDGVDIQWNMSEQDAFDKVNSGELDEGPIPAADVQNVAATYGVNKSRFWVKASPCYGLVGFNNRSDLFRGNAALRRAINWALDRTDYAGASPPYSATPWTHLLAPGFPGAITAKKRQPYSTRSDIEKARQLAAGHFRDGRVTVYYRTGTVGSAQAELVKRDLINLGFADSDITMKGFPGGEIYTAFSAAGSDADLAVSAGFCHDINELVEYFLPYSLAPPWFPASPKYRAKLAAVETLPENKQAKALGRLDVDIMRNVAPFAVMNYFNNKFFFSNRVDPRSLKYHAVYQDWSIPALALK